MRSNLRCTQPQQLPPWPALFLLLPPNLYPYPPPTNVNYGDTHKSQVSSPLIRNDFSLHFWKTTLSPLENTRKFSICPVRFQTFSRQEGEFCLCIFLFTIGSFDFCILNSLCFLPYIFICWRSHPNNFLSCWILLIASLLCPLASFSIPCISCKLGLRPRGWR